MLHKVATLASTNILIPYDLIGVEYYCHTTFFFKISLVLFQAVGERLVEVATRDPSLWVVAEALDAIFDTFGDGQMADVVADRLELVAKLKVIAPKLKAKVGNDYIIVFSRK